MDSHALLFSGGFTERAMPRLEVDDSVSRKFRYRLYRQGRIVDFVYYDSSWKYLVSKLEALGV